MKTANRTISLVHLQSAYIKRMKSISKYTYGFYAPPPPHCSGQSQPRERIVETKVNTVAANDSLILSARWALEYSWALIGLGKVKINHVNFDLKLQESLIITLFLNNACRNVIWIILNFWHDLKKWCFGTHFVICSSEVRPLPHPAESPLTLGVTATTDQPRAGEVTQSFTFN